MNAVIVYEQCGLILNLGQGAWTAIRKAQSDNDEKTPLIVFYAGASEQVVPFATIEERDTDWGHLAELTTKLAKQNLVAPVSAGIPPNLIRPFESR